MYADLTISDGQVAVSAAQIASWTGTESFRLNLTFTNTGVVSETLVLTIVRSGGTSRRIFRTVLAANEQVVVSGLAVDGDDVLKASTTTASVVDYTVSKSPDNTDFKIQTFDASGNLRLVDSRVRTGYTVQIGTRAKVGAAAGWTVGAADNLPYIGTVAASQTAATLVVPIDGLHIGDTITGFKVIAQIESAGGAVTLDGALRAVTNVAAEPTDASIGSMTQVGVSADTASAQEKTGLSEVVTSGKTYYLLLTATTAASTDIILQACEITVTTAP